jgi:hypothetical protein
MNIQLVYSKTWKTPQPDQLLWILLFFQNLIQQCGATWTASKQRGLCTNWYNGLTDLCHEQGNLWRRDHDMDCQQSMDNYGTPFAAHNGTGAQAEFQEGTVSTRLYTNATCHSVLIWNCLLKWRWVSSGIDVTTISITMLPQVPYFTHLHQSPVAKTESPLHCSQ